MQEIEKIVLITLNRDPITNAEFSVVSNLGSMIPRYLYAPIEVFIINNKINLITSKYHLIYLQN